jgi:hypothetical protein
MRIEFFKCFNSVAGYTSFAKLIEFVCIQLPWSKKFIFGLEIAGSLDIADDLKDAARVRGINVGS